jgi:nucleoside-diphosphate-sugar epimerase
MKILVTGAAGYFGSQLVSRLLTKGYKVRAFDQMYYGGESLLFAINNNNLEIVKGDIRNKEQVNQAMKSVDCVVHLAGIVGESACNVDKTLSWSINCDGAKIVVDAANANKLQKIIFTSTCSNYGVSKPNELVDENSELNPLSDYAKAKIVVEEYLFSTCKIPFTILRFGTLCGVSSSMRFDLLINEMSRAAALGDEIEIYTPQAWRPYLHISDAASSIEKIIASDSKLVDKNIFNVVGQNLKKADLVDVVLKHYPNAKVKITDKVPDLRDYRVSGDKFNKIFGALQEDSIEKAFLEVANAVEKGYFFDPKSPTHSAGPSRPLK